MKKIKEFLDEMSETNEQALYPTDFEKAIIGTVERFGQDPLILLDKKKCLDILMKRDGMSYEESVEFFDFNIIGSWMGEGTPCFASLLE